MIFDIQEPYKGTNLETIWYCKYGHTRHKHKQNKTQKKYNTENLSDERDPHKKTESNPGSYER